MHMRVSKNNEDLFPEQHAMIKKIEEVCARLDAKEEEKKKAEKTKKNEKIEKPKDLLTESILELLPEKKRTEKLRESLLYLSSSIKEYYLHELKNRDVYDDTEQCKARISPPIAGERLKNLWDELMGETLPPSVREELERLRTMSPVGDREKETRERREIIYRTIPFRKKKLPLSETAKENLIEKKVYGRKKEIADFLKAVRNGQFVILEGADGVGKELLFKAYAAVDQRKIATYSASEWNDLEQIKGTSKIYNNSTSGKILETIKRHGMNGCMFYFEDLDSVTDVKAQSVIESIVTNHFVDDFLETSLDMSEIVFVGTCKDSSKLGSNIRNIAKVIHMRPYTDEEKCEIAKRHFLPELLSDYEIPPEKLLIDAEVVKKLAVEYLTDDNVEEVKKNFISLFEHLPHERIRKRKTPLHLTLNNYDKYFPLAIVDEEIQSTAVREISLLKKKYMYNKYRYTDEICKEIKVIFQKLEEPYSDREKVLLNDRLYYLVNLLPGTNTNEELEKEDFMDVLKAKLDQSYYGREDVKQQILRYLAAIRLKGNSSKALLLVGPAGTGKTSITKPIADALGKLYIKVSLNGSDGAFLRGVPMVKPGCIPEPLVKDGVSTSSAVFLLDEMDKMLRSGYQALYDLLDGQGGFYDAYLDVKIPTDDILFCATANDIREVPNTLLDRFEVVFLDGYTKEEKIEIAKGYVIPRICEEYHVEQKVCFTEEAIQELVDKYCPNNGVRDLERAVRGLIEELEVQKGISGDSYSKSKKQIVVKAEDLETYLGKKKNVVAEKVVHYLERYGVACGAGVAGDVGVTMLVQVRENPYGEEALEITGLAKQGIRESAELAYYNASHLLGRELPKLRLHFSNGGIEKDGPSAGVAMTAAMLSYMLKCPIGKVALTGEIDLLGYITKVGGVKAKLTAAALAGVEKMYIPEGNYRELKEEGWLEKVKIEVLPCRKLKDLMCELFPKQLKMEKEEAVDWKKDLERK